MLVFEYQIQVVSHRLPPRQELSSSQLSISGDFQLSLSVNELDTDLVSEQERWMAEL